MQCMQCMQCPPTPAFAKAGAAPGTTAGVELFRAHSPLSLGHSRQLPPRPLAGSLCCSTLQKSGQLRKEKVPQQAQHAPLPHAKATTRPQQWLKGTPRPQQWLLIRVQGCRLPGLKPSKTLQNPPNPPKVRPAPQGKGTPTSPTRATAARKSHHKATAMAQGHPTPGFLYAFKAAVCQASNAPKPSKTLQTLQTLQKSGQLRREKVPQQAQHAPLPHAKVTTRPQQWLKGTPRPQQWLLIRVQGCRLPGLKRSKTLQNPPNPPNPPKVRPAPQGKGTPTSPTRATAARKSHHKATAMAQGHPTAAAMASYTRSRLPFARPQTLQNPPKPSKPSKPSKSPASSAGKRYPNKPNTRHCRTQKPPQGHSNGSRAPHGRSNGFLYAFKAAVCQASNAPKPSKTLQTLQTLQKSGQLRREKVPQQAQHAPLPHAKVTTRPQQWLKGTPRPQQWLLIRVQGCRLPGLKRSKTLQTLQTLQKSGQLRREKVPQQAQHAPLPHAKATTRPQQWLKGTPRPQQWLLIRVQGCRLPGLKPSKTLQNPPNPPKVRPAPQGKGTPTSPTRATAARKSHHKATAMAQGHPTAAAMASYTRSTLPFAGLKRSKTLQNPPNPPNPPKVRPAPQGKGTPTSPTRATAARKSHHKATAMAQGHPTAAAMASYTRSRLPFARPQTLQNPPNPPNPPKVRPAPSKTLQTLQTLQKSGQLRREKVPQQAQHAPLPHAKATTRPQQWLKGTPRPQQWLLIRVQGCRLPGLKRSKTLQNPPNPPNPPKVRPAPQGKGTPTSPTRATAARKSHHKATAMAQGHPTAAAMASYTRSRLPFARPQTLQNPPKPSKPSKSPASSAGKRYPNKPNTRHCRTQKPPQGHSNGSRAPHGRSNGFLYAFKAAVCQASNAPKPSKTLQTLQTLQKSGQLRREKVPQQAQHAPLPHAKATTRPQQWLKGTPRPQQWLLIRVQGCRLPGLKRSKTFRNPPNPPNPPKVRPAPQGKGTPTSPTRATAARKSHHKATAMAQGHPTAAAMASYTRSRLPFARPQTLQNPPKPSKPSKSPASSAGKRYPNKPNTRHCRTQKPPQGHSNGSRAPHGRSNGFLYAFKAAVCQASNPPKPSKTLQTLQTLQKSGQLRREKVPQQAQHAPLPHAKATTRPQQWLKGTPRPQQWLLIRVQGCRLPGLKRSKTLQNPPNPPNPPKVRPAPQGKGTPCQPSNL